MYLFPTNEDLKILWSEIDPKQRILRAMRAAVDYACSPNEDSMAAFFLESDDVDFREEESAMVYHIDPPAYLEHSRDTCPVSFRGWSIKNSSDGFKMPYCESVNWEDI